MDKVESVRPGRQGGKPHRAWMILLACCLLEAGTIGILWNCAGLFYAPICGELGFRIGDFSWFSTLRSLAGAFTVGVLTAMLHRVKIKPFLLSLLLTSCGAFAAMYFFDRLWQWYIAGAVMGIAGSSFFMVTTALFINNWFYKKNGFAIGVAMAASGLGGAVFNPVISRLIMWFGWRNAALMAAGTALALTVPAVRLIVFSPQEVGLAPYGSLDEFDPEEEKEQRKKTIWKRELARPGAAFAGCAVLLGACYFLSQYNGHLPTYVQHAGFGIGTAGTVTSAAMLGNVVSKIGMGWLADKKGVWFAVGTGLLLSVLSFLLLASPALPLIYCGAFCYGAALTMSTVPPALVTKHVYGLSAYESRYTKITMINQFIAALAFATIGYSRDFFGSYRPSFWFGICLCLVSAAAMLALRRVVADSKAETV